MSARFAIASTLRAGSRPGQKLLASLLEDAPRGYRVCYVGAAHDDSRWGEETKSFFEGLGAEVVWPRLTDPDLDVKAAREAISRSEVLYLDGGDTVECVRYARERKLVPAFREAARNAFLVYGLSGGACATAPYTIGYDDDGNGYVADCFAMGIPLPLDVHDEKNDWPEMRALLELVEAGPGGREAEGIVIPTGTVLLMDPEGKLSSRGKAPAEKRRLGKGGRWHVEAIPLDP